MNYKGMDKNMKCIGFQYEVGGEYETDCVDICKSGFHAWQRPLDVFKYYPPATSRYFKVEQSGIIQTEYDKTASTKIKIIEEISLEDMINDAVKIATQDARCAERINDDDYGVATSTGIYGSATSTGKYSAATSTGECSAATSTGECSAATSTGECGAATATGCSSAAAATGFASVAISSGMYGKAQGAKGCGIVLVERGEWNGKCFPITSIKSRIVDGKEIKENTWYTLKNGKIVEV